MYICTIYLSCMTYSRGKYYSNNLVYYKNYLETFKVSLSEFPEVVWSIEYK